MAITVARFLDVANGVQPGQFTVGDRVTIDSLDELDPIYKQLLDDPVTAIVSVTGGDGRANLTPVWFDYEGDLVLLNLATHRKKVDWLRKNSQLTFALMNPANAYHWLSIKCTVAREISEDDPDEGERVITQLNGIFTKYTGSTEPYALRDPSFEEKRVLFELAVDRVATFGKP
jgi:nitroimidazol reductase NimA-like FMN-containing flavoprotein (pyridoxamine 5'-phosphate oxidase superfamily)